MRRPGTALAFVALFVVAVVLIAWAAYEGRRQRTQTARVLASQATVLARSIGSGLGAASSASREIDEVVTWRLLDNVRLLAELQNSGVLTAERAERIAGINELDSILFVEPSGRPHLLAGEPVPAGVLAEIDDVTEGAFDELILDTSTEDGVGHVAVAARVRRGGTILIRVHSFSAASFAAEIGVLNLLRGLTGPGDVLYLRYREEPGGILHEASWDDGPIPEEAPIGDELRDIRGRPVFEVVVPVDAPAGTSASVQVGLDGELLVRAASSAMRRTMLVGIVLAGFGLALAGLSIVLRQRTLERAETARKLATAEERRRRHERLAAAGALTAGLAHEVRSPLNAISLSAQRIERKHPEARECGQFARSIREEVRRLDGVLRSFLDLAKPVADRREDSDLGALVREVHDLLSPEAEERGVRLEEVVDAKAGASIDRESVRRALINLTRNAVEATPRGGRVRTSVGTEDGQTRIRIADDGPGIPHDVQARVFDAFFTTRAAGVGLGLALVKRVADEHGGRCSLVNAEGGGAVAELTLPCRSDHGDAA